MKISISGPHTTTTYKWVKAMKKIAEVLSNYLEQQYSTDIEDSVGENLLVDILEEQPIELTILQEVIEKIKANPNKAHYDFVTGAL